jgi:hypothetical protein
MLTIPPGPDIAPYHDRQIAILNREEWGAWLDPSVSARTILKPLPPLAAWRSSKWVRSSASRPISRSGRPSRPKAAQFMLWLHYNRSVAFVLERDGRCWIIVVRKA